MGFRKIHTVSRKFQIHGAIALLHLFPNSFEFSGFTKVFLHLLVHSRVEKKCKNGWSRTVDGHRDRGVRGTEVKSRIEAFGIIDGADRNSCIAHFSVDVGTRMRIRTIKCHRVECGAQPCGRLSFGKHVKTTIGSFCYAFSGKHPGWILLLPFEGEDSSGVGELTWEIFQAKPACDFSKILIAWNGNFWDHQPTKAFDLVLNLNCFLPNLVLEAFFQVEFTFF